MPFFSASLNSQLYVASHASDRGFAAFLLPKVPLKPLNGYEVWEALTDSNLNGSFILSAYTPVLKTKEETDTFTQKLLSLLGTGRYIIWITDIKNFSPTLNTIFMPIASDGSSSTNGVTFPLATGLSLQIQSGIQLKAMESSILLGVAGGTGPKIQFSGPDAPDPSISNASIGTLPLEGSYKGCISFSLFIQRYTLAASFKWGFQMVVPMSGSGAGNQKTLSAYYPLASGTSPTASDNLGFDITIDPTDPLNEAFECVTSDCNIEKQYNSRRTFFNFTGFNQDKKETVLASYYFTTLGKNIQLLPYGKQGSGVLQARLVINAGEQNSSNPLKKTFAPEGDFITYIEGATPKTLYPLQCGLQGTEFFNIKPRTYDYAGDRLRFVANQPAYAPVYPLPASSPVAAPVPPGASLLDRTYYTSWLTMQPVTAPGEITYIAQPKGSALYGNNAALSGGLLGHSTPGFTFQPTDFLLFPMLPYSGAAAANDGASGFSSVQLEEFERVVISPVRKQALNPAFRNAQVQARLRINSNGNAAAADSINITTPSGLLVHLLGGTVNPVWESIYLAQNQPKPLSDFTKLSFSNPDDELVQAFQTSDLFLVIANNSHLGTPVSQSPPTPKSPAFYNSMFIGDWKMQVDAGTQNRYNNYNNIIIVKGRKGKLYDANDTENSLVSNWQKWTAKEQFASPSTLDSDGKLRAPDPTQLVILSQWMQAYFEDASVQKDTEYFGHFNAIAADPEWTGILILQMNITSLPDNLSGIIAGVRDPAAFRAHHFGINITPVQQGNKGPEMNSPSSMFGLIYYNDPAFVMQTIPEPVRPDLATPYDFMLLNMKVLFENTSVKSFQSYAQLTTRNYFGSAVTRMGEGGNMYSTMLLKGTLQFRGSLAIYSLGTEGESTFYFDSPVVNKIENTSADFSTKGIDASGNLVSWVALSGFWDFRKLNTENDGKLTSFDLFSFGNPEGQDNLRQGLLFNNLGIQITSQMYKPGMTEALQKTLTFDTSALTFDAGRSTARKDSIYLNFALTLQSYQQGTPDNTPSDTGFLPVVTDLKVTTVNGKPWVGLEYQLNMGTPGELAGNVGLTSQFLTAWDPTAKVTRSAPPVLVGIKLPGTGGGAKLISLQSVLKLSIGQIRLSFAEEQRSFLMMFTEIALRFFGLLKLPPNGSSLFYLFGNPKSGGKASGLGWYAMYKKDSAKNTLKSLTGTTTTKA